MHVIKQLAERAGSGIQVATAMFSSCENGGGKNLDGGSPRSVAKQEFAGERREERADPRSRLE